MTRDDEPPVTRPPTAWPKVLLKVALIVAALVLGLFIAVPMVIKIGGVRRDAKRMQGTGNMCQFALAAHSYADYDGGGFLGPYAQISSGVLNTELSFRVSLLPYLEQGNIHRLIDLKQPWDSVQNAPATSVAIKNLQSPDTPDRTKPDTPYRVFYGGGALFEADGTPV